MGTRIELPNQYSCIELRNSFVIGYPDDDPITESIPQIGQSAVELSSTISSSGFAEPDIDVLRRECAQAVKAPTLVACQHLGPVLRAVPECLFQSRDELDFDSGVRIVRPNSVIFMTFAEQKPRTRVRFRLIQKTPGTIVFPARSLWLPD